jgi:branched-subunit amino acid aminotransferase/4-amino-4-deoxychorismate lyase
MSEQSVARARVRSFELAGAEAVPLETAESLGAASSGLPAGAYTTLRTYGGRSVVRLDQHLRRLEESVAMLGRPARIDAEAARGGLGGLLDATGYAESRLRLTFAPPRLFASIEAFEPLPAEAYEAGVSCVTLGIRRENPHAKDTRFIATAQGAYGRLPAGVEEGLLVGEDGAILEGLSSNFFALLDGALRTEEDRALLGVTRSMVLEVAGATLAVERQAVRCEHLRAVTEAFITSVSRAVLPVTRIDGRPIGDGGVGPRTRAIMDGFAALVEREAERLGSLR